LAAARSQAAWSPCSKAGQAADGEGGDAGGLELMAQAFKLEIWVLTHSIIHNY
jgi:hypothetical protein